MRVADIRDIISALNTSGVRFLVVGGLAVNAHGYVRATVDLDLVIGLETANIIAGLNALQGIGYQPKIPITAEQFANAELREKFRAEKGMLVLQLWCDARRQTPIDIFVHEPFDFDTEWQTAVRFDFDDGLKIPVVNLPTLLAMKEAAGRDKDRVDIAYLRKLHP